MPLHMCEGFVYLVQESSYASKLITLSLKKETLQYVSVCAFGMCVCLFSKCSNTQMLYAPRTD